MHQKLADTLQAAGKETVTLAGADGSRLLVLPYGGRILGLYAPGETANFLWTNTALQDEAGARQFYASEAWKNSGGDRTWLSPEIDFFLPKFPSLDAYHQPRALDPGSYQVETGEGAIRLQMDFNLTPLRHGQPVALRLARAVQMEVNPLRHEGDLGEGVQFAGYSLQTTLEATSPSEAIPAVGIWSLLQMPHGGEMLIPTYGRTEPTIYFGDISPADLRSEAHAVRYRTRASGGHKIGVRTVSCTGRVGYHYQADGVSQLVVRNFLVNPSGNYVDVPWKNPGDLGYCVQICNVDIPEFGAFSELEYHAPAIGGTSGLRVSKDTSQVWAFRGSFAPINRIAEALLGLSLQASDL